MPSQVARGAIHIARTATLPDGFNPANWRCSKLFFAFVTDGVGKIAVQRDLQIFDLAVDAEVHAFHRLAPCGDVVKRGVELRQILRFHHDVKLAEIARPETELATGKPPTLDQVCEKALRLPCSPVLLPRLISVLSKEDSSSEELEAIIQIDPALASSTLRLANSAFFAAATPVDSLSEAIFRLGQRETYRLAALSLAGRWMSVEVDGYRW